MTWTEITRSALFLEETLFARVGIREPSKRQQRDEELKIASYA